MDYYLFTAHPTTSKLTPIYKGSKVYVNSGNIKIAITKSKESAYKTYNSIFDNNVNIVFRAKGSKSLMIELKKAIRLKLKKAGVNSVGNSLDWFPYGSNGINIFDIINSCIKELVNKGHDITPITIESSHEDASKLPHTKKVKQESDKSINDAKIMNQTGIYIAYTKSKVPVSIWKVQKYKTMVDFRHTKVGITEKSFLSRRSGYQRNFGTDLVFNPIAIVNKDYLKKIEKVYLKIISKKYKTVGKTTEWFDTDNRKDLKEIVIKILKANKIPFSLL